MLSGRRGPVALEMPWDQFGATAEVTPQDPLALHPNPIPDPEKIEALAKLLNGAKAPMLWVGGGALHAAAEIRALAERIGAPVVSFRGGRGIIDDRHPLGLTIPAGYRLWPETDLLVGFGTRLEVPTGRWGKLPVGLKMARIDIDPAEMARLKVDIGIVADTADAARALTEVVAPRSDAERAAVIGRAKADTLADIQRVKPQMSFLSAIRDMLPEDGIICDEMTQVGYVSWFGFPLYTPRSLITSGFSGTLGAGFPTALGVKVAMPDRAVVSLNGDGGFLFGGAELATAMQHRINLITIVFNNSAYGNVLRDQRRMFDGRESGSSLRNPDFLAYARSFGVPAWRVADAGGLRDALARALTENSPTLIEVKTDITQETAPWEFIAPGRG
jgi:acetolactate synthase-1/2/3 large subunit